MYPALYDIGEAERRHGREVEEVHPYSSKGAAR